MKETLGLGRLLWQSRRGALELDLLLNDYVNHHYATLSDKMQEQFKALLQEDDPNLMLWLVKKEPPPVKHALIVKDLLYYNASLENL